MKIIKRESEQIENRGHGMSHKIILLSGLVLAIVLVGAAGGLLHGQNPQSPPSAPQVAPEPPEPSEPPDPPESAQFFVMNDGAPRLGVTLGDVTAEKAQELKLPAVAGAIVESVQKNSVAAKAGIEAGDAIMEFDGVRVRGSAELRRLIRETPAGRTVEMKIMRDGKTRVLSAKLAPSSNHITINGPEIRIPSIPEIKFPPLEFPDWGDHRAALGISADDLTPQLAQYFGVKPGKGVLISEVTVGGAADKAGLKAGDVIVQVDGKAVSGVEELRAALNDNFTGDSRKVSLTIVRDRHEQTVNADLTRSHARGKHTSSAAGPGYDQDFASLPAQVEQLRVQADKLRALANRQRSLAQSEVQGEVLKQQLQLRGEWQRQLQEQMRSLQDQLKQLPNLRSALLQDDEI